VKWGDSKGENGERAKEERVKRGKWGRGEMAKRRGLSSFSPFSLFPSIFAVAF
jgi:hypothetical protein